MKAISGSCHCANIKFVLTWPENTTNIATRECSCSFCKKHGGAWTSNVDATLRGIIENSAAISKYQFGSKTAEFFICSQCGAVPFVVSDVDNHTYAVVNTNCFDDFASFTFNSEETDFEGEETDDRLARRKSRWIGQVEISNNGC